MSLATDQIAETISTAVEAGRLDADHAQRLMGRLFFDAMGIDLSGAGDSWRHELIALAVPSALIRTAQAELRTVNVRPAAQPRPRATAPRIAADRADRVLEHVAVLGDPAGWETATTYASLALALIDAVWSIGVRYTGVLNVLHRYRAARRGVGADPDRDTPADLIAFIGSCGGPDTFAAAVNNRQRTSSRNGILKADAVLRVAQVLVDAEVQSTEDLAAATPDQLAEVRRSWTAITGQGSGLSWDYFLMLAGRQGVKADRMVRRFVADALGVGEHEVSQRETHALITGAATQLQVPISRLDYAIWLHQSVNKPA